MERCPTCKSEVRPGAKFCTFCGTPLLVAGAPGATSADETAVFAAVIDGEGGADRTAAPAAASWPSNPDPAPVEAPHPGQGLGQDQDQDRVLSTTWPAGNESATREAVPAEGASWPSPAVPDVRPDEAVRPSNEQVAVSPPADVSAPAAVEVVAAETTPIVTSTAADDRSTQGSAGGNLLEPGVQSGAVDTAAEASPPVAVVDPEFGAEAEGSLATESRPVWGTRPSSTAAAVFSATPEAWAAVGGGAEDQVDRASAPSAEGERAAELLDELRSLLPALGATRLRPGRLADRLDAAVAADGEVPDGLRAAAEAARANPRDIDTVLELTRRIDDLIELVERHDRMAESVRSAARALRSGSEDGS